MTKSSSQRCCFGDNEIDTSPTGDVMLITDIEREEAALAAQKGSEATRELAVALQGTELQIYHCNWYNIEKY